MTGNDTLLKFVELMRLFIERKIEAPKFVSSFQDLWRIWRDFDQLSNVEKACTNDIDMAFTATDCYAPKGKSPRNVWSIDEDQLRAEISTIYCRLNELL